MHTRTEHIGPYTFKQRFVTREDFPPWGNWEAHAAELVRTRDIVLMSLSEAVFVTLFAPTTRTHDGVIWYA